MTQLMSSGRIIDVALAVIGLEAIALFAMRQRGAWGIRPLDLVGQLLAGALLLLAVRCAVTGADYRWTLALLGASFPAHMFDLARRARGASRASKA
jgi:hypothetical protein